ncbi:hypothetical protein LTR86_006844 [Recurvomyces mirabilis]|nr:hypothetical protein LTR86_006844 [Recurvomyces mirabilis]
MFFTTIFLAASAAAFPLSSNYSLPTIKARESCSPGINCVGTNQWFLCNPTGLAIVQPVAPGMICSNNQMIAAPVGGAAAGTIGSAPHTAAPSAAAPSSSQTPATTKAPASSSAAPTSSQPATSSNSAAPAPSSSASAASAPAASGAAISYTGDGSSWPTMNKWLSFDQLWTKNSAVMQKSCSQYNEANNSDEEIAAIKSAITSVAQSANIDNRFVLAIMMQESKGCVRVPTTKYSVANPGLMQDYAGSASCNSAIWSSGALVTPGTAQNPCPSDTITKMVTEGITGTAASSEEALGPLFKGIGKNTAQAYFQTARKYNSGPTSIPANGDLSSGGSTSSYASDVANRLIGAM